MPKKQKNSLLTPKLVVGGLVLLGVFGYFFLKPKNQSQQSPTSQAISTKTYTSENLNFAIEIPSFTESRELGPGVVFEIADNKYNLSRTATEFDSLSSHLENLDNIEKTPITNDHRITINSYDAARRLVTMSDSQEKLLSYHIFADGWVYVISTTSPDLYSDLDQIAQSFRYTGE